MRSTGLIVCVALAACSSTPTTSHDAQQPIPRESVSSPEDMQLQAALARAPRWTSGTRLRAHVLESSEGASRRFDGFYDSELKTDCAFALAGDGEHRCLPKGGDGAHLFYFRDPDCTQKVLRSVRDADSSCEPDLGPVIEGELPAQPTCNTRITKVYGIARALPAQLVYGWTDGGCTPQGEQDCLFEPEEMEAARFVRGELQSEPVDDQLALDWIAYEDGARVVNATRDRARDATCTADPFGATTHCWPTTLASIHRGTYFGDAACTVDAAISAVAPEGCTGASVAAEYQTAAECVPMTGLFALGPELPSFAGASAMCLSSPGTVAHAIGLALDPNTLPALGEQRARGDRLELDYYVGRSNQPLVYAAYRAQFHDVTLNVDCQPEPLVDGSLRCVPVSAETIWDTGPFLDADCSVPVVDAIPRLCAQPRFVRLQRSGDARVISVLALGPQLTAAPEQLFIRRDGSCQATEPKPSDGYYMPGETLELPSVSRRLE